MRHNAPSVPVDANASLRPPLQTIATRPKQPWNRDIQLMQICRDATYHTLKPLEPEILACCEACLQHNFMSRENQRKLESGLLRSLNIIATLDRISSDEVVAPPPPQRRHLPPPKLPDKPTMPTVPKARLSPEEEAKGKDLQNRIQALRDRHMREKLEYDAMERDLEDDLAEAEDKRRTLQKYFEKVNHEVAVARSGLDTVKDSQLIEMRGYIKPPDTVRKVLEAVLVVLGESEANNWTTMQHYIRQPDFIPSVRAVQDINGLSADSLRRIKQITTDPEFTTENARRASHACAPLVQWTHAMMHYYEVSVNARGLKDELERLDAEIAARQNELSNGGRKLRTLENEIASLQRDYDENFGPAAVARLNDKARHEATTVYRTAVADWRAKCNVIKEKHLAAIAELENRANRNLSPAKPPRPLLTRTVQTVEETRTRCQRLVDAIQATMEQLKGPHGNVIVVEKRVYPKPVPRPVSAAAARSFQDSVQKYNQKEVSAASAASAEEAARRKRARTPHTAPWRNGAKYKFDNNRRVPVTIPEKTEEEKRAEEEAAKKSPAGSNPATPNQLQQQQGFPQQQQQQQYDQFGQPIVYQDQQQQQGFDPYGQQQQQWAQPQQQQYQDPYAQPSQQQQWGGAAPQQQQWGGGGFDAYGGGSAGGWGGGGGGGGGMTFM